jgi:hypothetical protein
MSDEKTIHITATSHFVDAGQMRIQELPGAVPYGETALPIGPTEVAFVDQRRSDLSMMKEANRNRESSETFIATRGLIGRWNMAEIMLRAWVEPVKWKGSDQLRSHLGVPLVAEQFYSIHSVVNQTLFGGYQVFKIDATSSTPMDCAIGLQAILNAQLKTCGYKGVSAKTEMREITYDGLFYGFGVAHYGWQCLKQNIIKKVQKSHPSTVVVNGQTVTIPIEDEDNVEDKIIGVREVNMPKLEHVPIRRFRYAPDLRRGDPRVAEWCGRLIYPTGYDLDALRNTEGWNIPTRAQLVALMAPQMQSQSSTNPMETLGSNTGNPILQQTTTPQKALPETLTDQTQNDPLARKFEAFDYWTGTRHCIVLQKEYTLLNEEHKFGRPPFLGFCFRNAPDSAHGYGIAYWLTDFQRVCQGVINAFLDDVNLNLMGTYTAPAGTNNSAQAQWIFPGKIFKTDGPNKMEALTRNSINAQEPLAIIQQMKSWASSISGAGMSTLGGNPGSSGDVRTPGGVAAVTGGESVKLQDLIDVISEQVFIPFLDYCIEETQKLKPSQIRMLLSDELAEAVRATPLSIINGTYKVDISAGTKLAAREALNKYMGILETFLQSPGTVENLAGQAMKIDYNGMFSALFDTYGVPYKEKIIVPMNDEDKAYRQAQTQQAAMIGKLGVVHTQGDEKRKTDDNAAENRMLVETGKHALKTSGGETDHQNNLELQQKDQAAKAKLQAGTPQAQGLDRAAKGAFAKMDSGAFPGK